MPRIESQRRGKASEKDSKGLVGRTPTLRLRYFQEHRRAVDAAVGRRDVAEAYEESLSPFDDVGGSG